MGAVCMIEMSSEELFVIDKKFTNARSTIRAAGTLLKTKVPMPIRWLLSYKTLTVAVGGFISFVTKCPLSWNKQQNAELVGWMVGWLASLEEEEDKDYIERGKGARQGEVHTYIQPNCCNNEEKRRRERRTYRNCQLIHVSRAILSTAAVNCALIGECWRPKHWSAGVLIGSRNQILNIACCSSPSQYLTLTTHC